MKKISYPNYDPYQPLAPTRDVNKWMDTLKKIYFQERNGISKNSALSFLTKEWDEAELADFKSWCKFYEEGDHLKYKKAQTNFFPGSGAGYYIPIEQPKQEAPLVNPSKDIDYAKTLISGEMSVAEKKSVIERQRKKLIGRLDSVEKLLRTNDGELFAGNELEALIEAIYSLKKKIQLLNKISTATKMYDDMIVREANVLVKNGFKKAGNLLFSFAQDVAIPEPVATPAEIPSEETVLNSSMQEFLKNMDTANIAVYDGEEDDGEEKQDDALVQDENKAEDLIVFDEDLVSEAQTLPQTPSEAPQAAITPAEPAPPVAAPVEPTLSNFDEKLNQIFSDIKVDDVVVKLEEIANVFRTREVPRQLGVIDMMLNGLGLASLFVTLPEAVNKSLEANNYCLTRIEDIISKLRGSMPTTTMDLTSNESSNDPQASALKNKLQNDLDKEKERKERRKQQENNKEDAVSKETPQIELEDPNAPKVPNPATPTTT